MAIVDVQEIIEAGVHFGHRASRWHPKMKPFIFGKRNLIHIVDVRETVKGLVRASNFLVQLAASGKDVVLVGTKRQAKTLVMQESQRAGVHWVSERWLGGSLTNFHTIRQRLKRLEELEAMEANGTIEEYSKKRISALRRERRKILRNLEGLRNMKELPGCIVVVDIRREHIAVREARKTGIPVIGLVDTDCDPREVDIIIPGNDDAYRSIQVVLRVLCDAVILGRKRHEVSQAELDRARSAEAAQGPGESGEAQSREEIPPAAEAPAATTETAETPKVGPAEAPPAKADEGPAPGPEPAGGAGDSGTSGEAVSEPPSTAPESSEGDSQKA